MSDFGKWLKDELYSRQISQTQFAGMIRVTPAQVSRLISGEREPSNETLNNIAKALKLPREMVYREAGILANESEKDKLVEQILAMTKGLSEESKKDIYEYARMRRRIDEEKGQYRDDPKPRHAGT